MVVDFIDLVEVYKTLCMFCHCKSCSALLFIREHVILMRYVTYANGLFLESNISNRQNIDDMWQQLSLTENNCTHSITPTIISWNVSVGRGQDLKIVFKNKSWLIHTLTYLYNQYQHLK